MSRVRSFRFGPGSLESIALRMWAVPRAYESQARSIRARAIGSYTVYCGMGWEHLVDIDERHTVDLERPVDELERRLATAWTENDVGSADAAAAEMVDWALEGWLDPCAWEEEHGLRTGTALQVAQALGRQAVGIEMRAAHPVLIKRRLLHQVQRKATREEAA